MKVTNLFDSTLTWMKAGFKTEFLRADELAEGKDPVEYGTFWVIDGKGVLQATQPNTRGTYLKSPDVPVSKGFTFSTIVQRTSGVSGMTEVEMGKDDWGPIWHFEWNEGSLWYYLAKGARMEFQRAVYLGLPSPRLQFMVSGGPDGISFQIVRLDTNETVMHGTNALDWSLFGQVMDSMHINWVSTAGPTTSPIEPVTMAIEDIKIATPESVSTPKDRRTVLLLAVGTLMALGLAWLIWP